MRVAEVISLVDRLAPFALAEDWDNVGLIVGEEGALVARVMVALDVRLDTVVAAREAGCDLILSHHPPIFPSLDAVNDQSTPGRLVLAAIRGGVTLVAAHTNLDSATAGLNDHLAEALGLAGCRPLSPHPHLPDCGIGRVGTPTRANTVAELARCVSEAIGTRVLFTGHGDRPVMSVACCTGSGAGFIDQVRAEGVDAYVTGDLKYHDADRADDVALIHAPHAPTEEWAMRQWFPSLASLLAEEGVGAVFASDSTDPWTPSSEL